VWALYEEKIKTHPIRKLCFHVGLYSHGRKGGGERDTPHTKHLETVARRHQQTRVEHDGTEYQITVDSDHVMVKMIEWKEQDGRSIQLFGDVSKAERAEVLLDNPDLSSAKSYRRAYSHAKRRKQYA